jgi:hypothetical protein
MIRLNLLPFILLAMQSAAFGESLGSARVRFFNACSGDHDFSQKVMDRFIATGTPLYQMGRNTTWSVPSHPVVSSYLYDHGAVVDYTLFPLIAYWNWGYDTQFHKWDNTIVAMEVDGKPVQGVIQFDRVTTHSAAISLINLSNDAGSANLLVDDALVDSEPYLQYGPAQLLAPGQHQITVSVGSATVYSQRVRVPVRSTVSVYLVGSADALTSLPLRVLLFDDRSRPLKER